MRTTRWRIGGLAVGAGLLAVGLTGCQGGGTEKAAQSSPSGKPAPSASPAPAEALGLVGTKLSAVRSAKATMTMTVPPPSGSSDATIIKASGTVGWQPAAVSMAMTSAQASGSLRTILVGGVEYVNLGTAGGAPQGVKPWTKVDLAQAGGGAADALTDSLDSDEDPSSLLETLLSSPQVRRVGSATVDGVIAERYTGDFTPADATDTGAGAKLVSPSQRAALVAQLKKQGVTSEHIDVWVGTNDLPVRTDVSVVMPAGTTKMSLHYTDYSAKAASITAPPADQTQSFQDAFAPGVGG